MKECEFGNDAEKQKDCPEYEKSDKSIYCFKFRKGYGGHCNGLPDRTIKEKE
jgi:hypothetical protein